MFFLYLMHRPVAWFVHQHGALITNQPQAPEGAGDRDGHQEDAEAADS